MSASPRYSCVRLAYKRECHRSRARSNSRSNALVRGKELFASLVVQGTGTANRLRIFCRLRYYPMRSNTIFEERIPRQSSQRHHVSLAVRKAESATIRRFHLICASRKAYRATHVLDSEHLSLPARFSKK
ncbi:hypothetical protein L1887_45963 [Cichorium endivia]|nr:hypothetical protein L1887_45963 [Cichorium endivia]